MRVILVGKGSFIAKSVALAARSRGLQAVALAHNASLDSVREGDSVINFTLDPRYRTDAYSSAIDRDFIVAERAFQAGAFFTMLSTRRVYDSVYRWNAREDSPALGDETAYGRNKAQSEKAVMAATGQKAGIFRLPNVFGYEPGRDSFFGRLLTSLVEKNEIHFDMHPDTERDFLPVDVAAGALLDRCLQKTAGIYNLGSGIPLPCGRLAEWVCQGFGAGQLICDSPVLREAFFLNMDKWRDTFGPLVQEPALREYCIRLGQKLRCEKS